MSAERMRERSRFSRDVPHSVLRTLYPYRVLAAPMPQGQGDDLSGGLELEAHRAAEDDARAGRQGHVLGGREQVGIDLRAGVARQRPQAETVGRPRTQD